MDNDDKFFLFCLAIAALFVFMVSLFGSWE